MLCFSPKYCNTLLRNKDCLVKPGHRVLHDSLFLFSLFFVSTFPTFAKNFSNMATNRTFTMIKPDAVANGHIGAILNDIIADGFKIVAMKYIQLTKETAGSFYAVHKERPFYGELVEFMTSGPIVA